MDDFGLFVAKVGFSSCDDSAESGKQRRVRVARLSESEATVYVPAWWCRQNHPRDRGSRRA
jgi:hypothetical protein